MMAPRVTPRATPLAMAVDLRRQRNASDDLLAGLLDPAYGAALRRVPSGRQVFRGLPFQLAGPTATRRWIVLDRPIAVNLGFAGPVSHVVIAHFCDSWRMTNGRRPLDLPVGWVTPVGQPLAHYTLETADGRVAGGQIRRRFEINEGIIGWGQGAFAARPHLVDEPLDWRGPLPGQQPVRYVQPGQAGLLAILPGTWGPAQTGVADTMPSPTDDIVLWLHEIAVPDGSAVLSRLHMEPLASPDGGRTVVVAAVTVVRATASPLRLAPRRSLSVGRRVTNQLGDRGPRGRPPSIAVDLGQVIRRRPAPVPIATGDGPPDSVPGWGSARSEATSADVLVDVAMAADAALTIDEEVIQARNLPSDGRRRRYGAITIEPLPSPNRRLEVELVDAATGQTMPARVHFQAADGRYLPPLGHRDEINPGLNEDTGADVVLGGTAYAYVPARFSIELPPGIVHVEAARGFGYRPLRRSIEVDRPNAPLVLALEPVAGPAGDEWVAADCHVHFISPTSALLQAQAEGVGIVNLLATQWGDHHTSVVDLPAIDVTDRSGRHLVVMGSENRQNMLGHIGLLGASRAVLPMASGGSPEGRLGDPLEWLLADWTDAARAQRGLAIAVHFPLPYAEVAADIVAGKIEAIELQALTPGVDGPSIREWYRFLNCGFRLPVVGGTDKMTSEIPLGAIRTYARLNRDQPLSFESWADAVRAGRTFVSSGPFIELVVDGREPGEVVRLGRRGGTVDVRASAWAALPVIDGIELIHDGAVVASVGAPGGTDRAVLEERVRVTRGGWLAARATSGRHIHSAFATAMGAHTSPIYLEVPGRPRFDPDAAAAIGTIIDGARTWVESIATVASDADRRRLAGFFASSRAQLDQRIRDRATTGKDSRSVRGKVLGDAR
jgi:hypothetical protein